MNDLQRVLKSLRRPLVLLPIGGAILLVIIWLAVFYLPQGSKLSKYDAQESSLRATQLALNERLQSLKKLSNSDLCHLYAQYATAAPSSLENTTYLRQINLLVEQSGLHLISISTGSQSGATSAGSLSAVPYSLNVSGPYDDQLKLMQEIYSQPRLTTISSVTLSGGGPATNRSTPLQASYSLMVYDTASPAVAASATSATTSTTTTVPTSCSSTP